MTNKFEFIDWSSSWISNFSRPNSSDDLLEVFSDNIRNLNLMPLDKLEELRRDLLNLTEKLYKRNNSNKPIVIVSDWTYLDLKESLLRDIYGENNFQKYVKIVKIKYNDSWVDLEELDSYFKNNIHANSLIILWWSVSDIVEINPDIESSYFFWFLKDLINWTWNISNNNFLLWICYGHQLISHIAWNEVVNCGAEFKISTTSIRESLPEFYEKALSWITNNWNNSTFDTVFTRSWKVSSNKADNFVDLMSDQNAFWNIQETFLSIQFHPEVPMWNIDNVDRLKKELNQLWVDDSVFDFKTESFEYPKSVDLHFFIPFLNTSLGKILDNFDDEDSEYKQYNTSLINTNKMRSLRLSNSFMEEESLDDYKFPQREEYFNFLYENGLLSLNSFFDRKVDRGTSEVSSHLWVDSITDLIKDCQDSNVLNDWDPVFMVRDIWAWDWSFLEEAYKELWWRDILLSWVWDKIYIDLYKWIKNSRFAWEIPDEVIKIFVKKFIQTKEEMEVNHWEKNIKNILSDILENIHISSSDVYFQDTMFSDSTKMYSYDWWVSMSNESAEFVKSKEWIKKISELKTSLLNDFLWFIRWYFERIFISDFNSYFDTFSEVKFKFSPDLEKTHFNVSVRWTSHLDNENYFDFVSKLIRFWLKEWAIFIDDWILRSYSFENRLMELYNLKELFSDSVDIKIVLSDAWELISTIIQKKPLLPDIDISNYLSEWNKLVDIKEIYNYPNLIVDYYVRNLTSSFIFSVFWNYSIDSFTEFNQLIDYIIHIIILDIKNWNSSNIDSYMEYLLWYIWNKYLSDIKRNRSLQQFENLKNWLSENKKYHKSISKLINNISNLNFENYDKERQLVDLDFDIDFYDMNMDLYIEIFDMILNRQRSVRSLSENDMNAFIPMVNFLSNIDNIYESWVLEELSHLFPYIWPMLDNKESILQILWADKNNALNDSNTNDSSNELLFWSNIKILIVDNISSVKKVLDIMLTNDYSCKKDNVTMLSNVKEWIVALENNDFDIILVQEDLDIYDNYALSELALSKSIPIIYLWSNESDIQYHSKLQKRVQKPFNKDTIISSIRSFETINDSILTRIESK